MNSLLPISKEQLQNLFPFHLILDKNLSIISVGKSIHKLLPGVLHQNLTDHFTFYRTHIDHPDFISLSEFTKDNLFLRNKDNERILFRYQVIYLEKQEQLLLAGTLWVTEVELLSELNLQLSDFALHDTITDMLQVIKSKAMVNDEMKGMLNTYQKQKKEIQQYKDDLLAIINTIPTAILVEDENRNIVYTNIQFCELFEIPLKPEEMIGINCASAAEQSKNLFIGEEKFVSRINQLLEENIKVESEILIMKNGQILERDFIPLFTDKKRTGLIWQYKNVTQQKKGDLILKQNEEKYRGLVENLKLGLLEVDLNEKITKVYPSFCEMTGYSEEELIGHQATKFLVLDEADIHKIENETIKRLSGINSVYEVRMHKKNGEVMWVIISGAPLYNLNNEVIGSISIHWDISLQKKKEEELRIAKELAEKSSQTKKSFMAKMSHELRTPLNVIQGMTQLLKNTHLNSEQEEDIQTISDSAGHLLNLVNDLLDIAKIESGKITLLNHPFSMKDLVFECSTQHYHLAREKGIKLNLKLHPEASIEAVGDKVKVKQIITNLLSNAIKFTDKGEVEFEVNFKENQFEIIVSDTGIGIPLDKQQRVFELFTQESDETSIKYGGTGLGLSITKELTELMGGQIEMKSKVGSGTQFLVKLPLKTISSNENKTRKEQENILLNSDLKKVSILIAEDNLLNQKLIQKIMNNWGCEYDLVENGKMVLSKLNQKDYDILLLDVLMPEMDGIETIREIRSNKQKKYAHIPVIGLTAQGSEEEKKICLESGMNSFINKPFQIENLKAEILKLLSQREKHSLIDLRFFEENGINDPKVVEEMIKTYLETSAVTMATINQSLRENQLPKIKLEIHSLKSNAKLFGIDSLSKILEDLEHMTELDSRQLENLLDSINYFYSASCLELKKHLTPKL